MSVKMELQPLGPEEMFSQPPEWIFDCQYVEENAAGLALGALDPAETMRITSHLSWCPNCARRVHEARKTVGYLPFTSPQATPPASAKSKLFERINAAEQLAPRPAFSSLTIPASTIHHIDPPLPSHPNSTPPAVSPPVAPPGRRRFKWEVIAAPLAAVPLVVALAIVGGWALRTQDRLNDQVTQARTYENEIADLTDQVSLLSSGLGNSQTRRFMLSAADSDIGGSSATGTLVGIVNKPWASLSVRNLPVDPNGYQVIVETRDGRTYSAGTFTVDQSGNADYELELTRPLQEHRSIHVLAGSAQERTVTNDSVTATDILWMDMESNLGASVGTEARAKAN